MAARKARFCRVLALAACIFASEASWAQIKAAPKVYYVRNTGNDANDGLSATRAFRTVQKGLNALTVRGSTLYIGPGTYSETLTLANKTRSGNSRDLFSVIGDGLGRYTLDAPGSVVIDGRNTQGYGLNMQSCDDWYFENLTFANQTQFTIYGYKVNGLTIRDCVIDVPAFYGICLSDTNDCEIRRNQLRRDANSGHCIYVYITGGSASSICENRMSMTGSLYRSTGFRTGQLNLKAAAGSLLNSTYSMAYASYGVMAMASNNNNSTLTVQNNVISDTYMGLYVYSVANGAASQCVISNNTVTASYYGLYVYAATARSITCTNNLVNDCYVTHYIYAPQASVNALMSSGSVLTPTVNANLLSSVITGVPKFKDAAGGDFSLTAGSRGVDEGVATGAPTTDVLLRARPFDGNRDGVAGYDIGAFESNAGSRIRVVRYRGINKDGEAEPAKDYETALVNRLGTNLGTTIDTTLTKVDTSLTAALSLTKAACSCGCSAGCGGKCKCGAACTN